MYSVEFVCFMEKIMEEQFIAVKICLHAVSYTHLDVYKRQALLTAEM